MRYYCKKFSISFNKQFSLVYTLTRISSPSSSFVIRSVTILTQCTQKNAFFQAEKHRYIANKHFFKVSNSMARKKCEIYSKLTMRNVVFDKVFIFYPENIYLFRFNNRNTKKRWEIRSELSIRHQNDVIDVAIVFLLLSWNLFYIFV